MSYLIEYILHNELFFITRASVIFNALHEMSCAHERTHPTHSRTPEGTCSKSAYRVNHRAHARACEHPTAHVPRPAVLKRRAWELLGLDFSSFFTVFLHAYPRRFSTMCICMLAVKADDHYALLLRYYRNYYRRRQLLIIIRSLIK